MGSPLNSKKEKTPKLQNEKEKEKEKKIEIKIDLMTKGKNNLTLKEKKKISGTNLFGNSGNSKKIVFKNNLNRNSNSASKSMSRSTSMRIGGDGEYKLPRFENIKRSNTLTLDNNMKNSLDQ